MKIKYKNNYYDWIKYIFSLTIMLGLVVGLGVWQSIISLYAAGLLWGTIIVFFISSLVSNVFARNVYTVGLRFGFIISLPLMYLILLIIYILILLPTGLLLRVFRTDLLKLKNYNDESDSYWVEKKKFKFSKKHVLSDIEYSMIYIKL